MDALLSRLLREGKVSHRPQLIPQQHTGGFCLNISKNQAFLAVFSGEDKNMTPENDITHIPSFSWVNRAEPLELSLPSKYDWLFLFFQKQILEPDVFNR